MPKIALAVITRHLNEAEPLLRFLDNAKQYGHHVDRLIVAYSHGIDSKCSEELRRSVRLDIVKAHNDTNLRDRLQFAGLSSDEVKGLLDVPSWPSHREVPYGNYRTAVFIHALLEKVDYLLFFDTDVRPQVLTAIEDGNPICREIDFVGTHMTSLTRPEVVATTSEYSGYYIIPPMVFEGLEDLLIGLGKETAVSYMAKCQEHFCINFGSDEPGSPTPSVKPLGGNLGLSLDAPRRLAPFFSTIYTYADKCIKGRGEDTLLGHVISASTGQLLDVDLLIFHDTHDDFPRVPDIQKKIIRDRFYWACLGWIGRNPFLTWFRAQTGTLESSFETEMDRQRKGLAVGGPKAAEYLDDPRFEELPAAFDASRNALPQTINRYGRLMGGWVALLDALTHEALPGEPVEEEGQQLPLAS